MTVCGSESCARLCELIGVFSASKETRSFNLKRFTCYSDVCEQMNKVDQATHCVKLLFVHADDESLDTPIGEKSHLMDPGKWIAVTQIRSIIGILPVVPAETSEESTLAHLRRTNQCLFHVGIPWYENLFYVNRYYNYENAVMFDDK